MWGEDGEQDAGTWNGGLAGECLGAKTDEGHGAAMRAETGGEDDVAKPEEVGGQSHRPSALGQDLPADRQQIAANESGVRLRQVGRRGEAGLGASSVAVCSFSKG